MEKEPTPSRSSSTDFLKHGAAAGAHGARPGSPPSPGLLNQWLQKLGIGAFSFQEGPLLGKLRRIWFPAALALLLLLFVFRHLLDVQIGWRGSGGGDRKYQTEKAAGPEKAQGSLLPFSERGNERPDVREQLRAVPRAKREQFVRRFGQIAQREARKFGIPASVILGSAMIHSLAGSTSASLQANNLFAISCRLNPIEAGVVGSIEAGGQCVAAYENAWTSFRAHSLLLGRKPFASIADRAGHSPARWARELSAAGYTAVPDFEALLLEVIQENRLGDWD
jgi:hypothetical protein